MIPVSLRRQFLRDGDPFGGGPSVVMIPVSLRRRRFLDGVEIHRNLQSS